MHLKEYLSHCSITTTIVFLNFKTHVKSKCMSFKLCFQARQVDWLNNWTEWVQEIEHLQLSNFIYTTTFQVYHQKSVIAKDETLKRESLEYALLNYWQDHLNDEQYAHSVTSCTCGFSGWSSELVICFESTIYIWYNTSYTLNLIFMLCDYVIWIVSQSKCPFQSFAESSCSLQFHFKN